MHEIVDPSQDLVHLTMLALNNIWFVLSVHNTRDKFLVISSRQWLILIEEVMEDGILLNSTVIVERQGIRLIHVIETLGFPPQFKFKNQKADCNNN